MSGALGSDFPPQPLTDASSPHKGIKGMSIETLDIGVRNEYELLNILDAKSSALLTFNAIFLATLSVWLGYIPPNWLHFSIDIVFIILLYSCAVVLEVVWLEWADFDWQQQGSEHTRELRGIRWQRTNLFWLGWRCAGMSIVIVVTYLRCTRWGPFSKLRTYVTLAVKDFTARKSLDM